MALSFTSQRRAPIPLLKPRNSKPDYQVQQHDRKTGLIILGSTVTIFILSISALFNFIRIPSLDSHNDLPLDNYYSYAILLIPVGAWIWCFLAWTGIKLFKHAKGGASVN